MHQFFSIQYSLISNHKCCSQEEANRSHLNSTVVLMSDQIRKLTAMNKSSEYDSRYVGYLLSIVFGEDILKISSAQGTDDFNHDCYMPLDPIKLGFIESMYQV